MHIKKCKDKVMKLFQKEMVIKGRCFELRIAGKEDEQCKRKIYYSFKFKE